MGSCCEAHGHDRVDIGFLDRARLVYRRCCADCHDGSGAALPQDFRGRNSERETEHMRLRGEHGFGLRLVILSDLLGKCRRSYSEFAIIRYEPRPHAHELLLAERRRGALVRPQMESKWLIGLCADLGRYVL